MLQLVGNSNPGCFNNEWVHYSTVQELLAKQDQGKAITSYALTPLFRGKSTNSPSFLFAVLKQEGLVQLSESKKRCYDRCSDAAFLANVKKLIDGKAVPASSNDKAGKNNKGKVAEATSLAFSPRRVSSTPAPISLSRAASRKASSILGATSSTIALLSATTSTGGAFWLVALLSSGCLSFACIDDDLPENCRQVGASFSISRAFYLLEEVEGHRNSRIIAHSAPRFAASISILSSPEQDLVPA